MTTWTMEKAVEELERGRQRSVIGSQPVARGSEKTDGKIAPV